MSRRSLLSLMSPRLLEFWEAKQDQSLHDYCFYHPLVLNLLRLCWDSESPLTETESADEPFSQVFLTIDFC